MREHGDAQFVLPDVLNVPPISNHGQPAEIIRLFGGPDQLRPAVNELQGILYGCIKKETREAPTDHSADARSLLKSARDIMRKDKGLNGDLDRLPLLTWIMFLKFLDDLEHQREEEAALARQEIPRGHRAALSLARLGSEPARHYRRRAAGLHQSG